MILTNRAVSLRFDAAELEFPSGGAAARINLDQYRGIGQRGFIDEDDEFGLVR
jgi:hypothetical protein